MLKDFPNYRKPGIFPAQRTRIPLLWRAILIPVNDRRPCYCRPHNADWRPKFAPIDLPDPDATPTGTPSRNGAIDF